MGYPGSSLPKMFAMLPLSSFTGKTKGWGLLLFAGLLCAGVQAQQKTGKLTGKITDGTTNQPLVGVSVSAKGRTTGTSTIADGTYILSLPEGVYTVQYSYTGYQQKEVTGVAVKAGETAFLDIIMQVGSNQLTGVVISTSVKRETQSAVYNRQRTSSAASDGISQESIARTPDNNAGQILRRVTGVNVQDNRFVVVRGLSSQYNQTMLNGTAMTSTETNRNAFSFDLIPAAVIDNIVINKTATPDMPGNFAGGVVQITTKDFPANNFLSVAVQGGFSDQTIGKNFYGNRRTGTEWLGLPNKSLDLPDGFPTALSRVNLVSLNRQEQYRYLRQLPNNLVAVNHGPSGLNSNFQLGYGRTLRFGNRQQFGIVAAVTQRKTELIEQEELTRNPQGFDIFSGPAGGIGPRFGNYSQNTRYRYSSDLGAVLNLAYTFGNNKFTLKNLYSSLYRDNYIKRDSVFSEAFSLGTVVQKNLEELEGFAFINEQRSVLNSVLAGEHKTGRNRETQLDWNVSVSANQLKAPDTRNFLIGRDSLGRYSPDIFGISVPQTLRAQSRLWNQSKDFITGGSFSLMSVFELFGAKQIVKSGLLFQNRRRRATGTLLPIEGFQDSPLDSIFDPSNIGGNGLTLLPVATTFTVASGNYNASTGLQAAYESLENRFGKFRVIWGLRVERYQQSVNVYNPVFFETFRRPQLVPAVAAARSTVDFLPSVNVVYSPQSNMNVRAAYSATVIRPDLRDLAEFLRFDFQNFQLVIGNANLRSTSVKNYDLKFEWFPSSGEILSASAFYKTMVNPIEYGQVSAQNQDVDQQVVNTGNAVVRGLEMEVRKRLDFIKPAEWLQNVTVFGNGSLMRSRVEATNIFSFLIPEFPEHKLTGQPEYILNFGATVSAFKNRFEVTGSFNRTGDNISDLGSSDFQVNPLYGRPLLVIPHFVLQARDQVDLSARLLVANRKGQFKFNVTNLLAEPFIIYQDFNGNERLDRPVFRIDKDPSTGQGRVVSGVDNVSSYLIGQRTYSLSFTYTFGL